MTPLVNKYSRKQVTRAGETLISEKIERDSKEFQTAMDILSHWRFSHESALEDAFNELQKATQQRDKKAIFAKRLKRHESIERKLKRFKNMNLKNMQDIGGCRAIVSNSKKIIQISRDLKKHDSFRNAGHPKFKDYLANPKEDGYRGFHIVGKFKNDNGEKKQIEVQLRSRLQHDWATALEIIDLFTGQALKSNQGKKDWKEFFVHASRQFAVMEEIHLFEALSPQEKIKKYSRQLESDISAIASADEAIRYINKLDIIKQLEAFAHSLKFIGEHIEEQKTDGYVLLEIDTQETTLSSTIFPKDNSEEAEKRYVDAEKKAAITDHNTVALVSTTAVGGIKEAYPNYFADSSEFIHHLEIIIQSQNPTSSGSRILDWLKKANL